MKNWLKVTPVAVILCGAAMAAGPVRGQNSGAAGPFHVTQEWKIGGDGGWITWLSIRSRSCCM